MKATVPLINEVAEYTGQPRIRVSATQLGGRYTAAASRRVLAEWVTILSTGPTPIRDLEFTSRTPKRLFAALAAQTQLERLSIKWGDYADLSVLTELINLRTPSWAVPPLSSPSVCWPVFRICRRSRWTTSATFTTSPCWPNYRS